VYVGYGFGTTMLVSIASLVVAIVSLIVATHAR